MIKSFGLQNICCQSRNQIKPFGNENLHPYMFLLIKKKRKQKKKSCHNINDPMSAELFLLKAFIIYSLNSKSINWSFVCQLCKRWMCDPVNGRLFTVYLSSISVAMVTVITLRRNYWVNNLFFQSQLELYLFYIFFIGHSFYINHKIIFSVWIQNPPH